MLKTLLDTIAKTVIPNAADIELCKSFFEPITPSRNTIIEEQHNIPANLYFIVSGCVRLFYFDEKGEEKTTCLSSANSFIACFLCFINQVSATENIECITDCELLKISHANLKTLIDKSENFKKFSLIIFEQAISSTAARANDLATLTAEQCYKKLITQQPQIVKNVPIQYTASYLGIKPQSLSRIRRQIK